VAATGQCGKIARVQIWDIDSCVTISTISNPAIQRRIVALSWSRTGSHLVAVGGDDNRTAFVFSFLRRTNAAQVYKENIQASVSKDSADNATRQPVLMFASPALLFSVAMQVPVSLVLFLGISQFVCSQLTCSLHNSTRSVEMRVHPNFGLSVTKW
jgi:hypothetical protein